MSAIKVLGEIAYERGRQANPDGEGFTFERDDKYVYGELASAAASYAYHASRRTDVPFAWPWDFSWWKPTTRRRDLIKAAALIVAEIERLDRLEA